MPNWKDIQKEWEITKITFKALAEKHDVKEGTLKSRRSREKWTRNKDATKKKKDATIKKVATIKGPVVMSDDLNDKQRLFCIYYIKYFNATKAYQKAYECAYTTAMTEGHRSLRNPKITAEIERMKEEKTSGLMLDVKDILQKYIDIAFSDIGDYVQSEDGFLVSLRPFDEVDTSIVSEISNTENGPKIKMTDKMKALEMLSKYFDLLSNDDKKRLQEEKLKADIAKTRADVDKVNDDDKPIEILIRRKEKGDG